MVSAILRKLLILTVFIPSLSFGSYIFNPGTGTGNDLTCGATYYILPNTTTGYVLGCPGYCLTLAGTNDLLLEDSTYLLLENGDKLRLEP